MPLVPFDEIVEDGDLETRVAVVPSPEFGKFGVPWGEYHMRELYCTDLKCDCQAVQVHFIHESCMGRVTKSRRAPWRRYGWVIAGGKRRGPIAASVNYCWGRRKQRAYVRSGQDTGHWLELHPVTPDYLGVLVPRELLFRSLLRFLLKEDPSLKKLFVEHYRMIKRKMASEPLASRAGLSEWEWS